MHTILLVHPLDPRGDKVGGIETHVRQFLKAGNADVRVILVGLDDTGSLPLRRLSKIEFAGRTVELFPVIRYPASEQHKAAGSIARSLTFNFFLGLLRAAPALRRLAAETGATADVQRVEFSWALRLMGIPFVQMLHGEGDKRKAQDTILKNYWVLHETSERNAVTHGARFHCVTENASRRIRETYPAHAGKVGTLTVGVDTSVFAPTPFRTLQGPLKLGFMGRLDAFKRPEMMLAVARRLREIVPEGVEFHYVGNSDPGKVPGLVEAGDLCVLHGFRTPAEIAEIWKDLHLGILTSEFEGTPVFVLEALASGRPMISVKLPQLSHLIVDGLSGRMLDVNDPSPGTVDLMAQSCLSTWQDIQAARLDPNGIAAMVEPLSTDRLMQKIFDVHRGIGERPPLVSGKTVPGLS